MILEQLSSMTIRNPIFMIILFGSIWYLPGIIVRRRIQYLREKKQKEIQTKKISSLYPKKNET